MQILGVDMPNFGKYGKYVMIFLAIAGLGVGGYFLYEKFKKSSGSQPSSPNYYGVSLTNDWKKPYKVLMVDEDGHIGTESGLNASGNRNSATMDVGGNLTGSPNYPLIIDGNGVIGTHG